VEGISSGHRKSEERRLMAEIDVNLERLRDEFAMSTLSSSLSLTHPITDYEKQEVFQDRTEVDLLEIVASRAYAMADAMLEWRKKWPTKPLSGKLSTSTPTGSSWPSVKPTKSLDAG
jgi:hypothetical protein